MKKLLFITTIIISLIASGKIDIYPETATITKIENDIVTVETFSGNQFEFSGVEDWAEGDIVSMIMYGNYTEKVEDDKIIRVKYSGYVK